MLKALALLAATSLFSLVNADLQANLNYRSPSLHPRLVDLEIKLDGVQKRITNDKLRKRDGSSDAYYTGNLTFPYGVASGDPYNNSLVLWTFAQKYDVEGLYGGNSYPPICLEWQISKSASDFTNGSLVNNGQVTTTIDVRWTSKVVASGLQPYTQYYYRFISCAGEDLGPSPVGAFKTLPNSDDDEVDQIRLAVFSCSNLPFGFFNAYGHAANNSESLDYVQHVGDYIYEYQNGAYGDGTALGRVPLPLRECASLDDYRDRYQSYRLDTDLQNLHGRLAWQTVWDDHEVADQAYKAGTADSNNTMQGAVNGFEFTQRKANAVRAYFEWMPIRQVDTDDNLRIWRTFQIGKLADMIMLDTRQYNRSITDLYWNTNDIRQNAYSPDRSMTGEAEQNWFMNEMSSSSDRGATWRLVMQQVVFNRVNYTVATSGSTDFDFDDWEGYRYQRRQVVSYITDQKINNTVILSGDSHASWVFDLTQDDYEGYDPETGSGAVGVEFAGSAVSSPSSYGHLNDTTYVKVAAALTGSNPSLQYAEGQLRGYFQLSVTPSNVSADFYGFYEQSTRNTNVTHMGTFVTDVNTNRLKRPISAGWNDAFGAVGAGK